MSVKTPKRSLRRFVLLSITAACLFATLALIPSRSVMSGAAMWFDSLSAEQRDSFLQPGRAIELPVEYRRALMTSLGRNPEKAARFWKAVAADYRQRHALTMHESQALAKVEELFTPAHLGPSGSSPELKAAMVEAKRVLGAEAARELFRYGGPATSSAAALDRKERLLYGWRRSVAPIMAVFVGPLVPAASADDSGCQCGTGNYEPGADENCWEMYNESSSDFGCTQSETYCPEILQTEMGCGFLWLEHCDARCNAGMPIIN